MMHCYWVNVSIAGDSENNGSFSTYDNLKYLNLSHWSSNGLSIEQETIENPFGVLPYQFEPEFNLDGPENHICWGLTRSQ